MPSTVQSCLMLSTEGKTEAQSTARDHAESEKAATTTQMCGTTSLLQLLLFVE